MRYENSCSCLVEDYIMIKKILSMLLLIFILFTILFATGCKNKYTQEDMDACRDITTDLLTISYDFYNDYSKLPKHYKSMISNEEFSHISIRAGKEYEDLGELGKDYYERYYLNEPKTSVWNDKICVSFTYEYGCYSYKDRGILYYDSAIETPGEIFFEEGNEGYTVIKAMCYIAPGARESVLEEMENNK